MKLVILLGNKLKFQYTLGMGCQFSTKHVMEDFGCLLIHLILKNIIGLRQKRYDDELFSHEYYVLSFRRVDGAQINF